MSDLDQYNIQRFRGLLEREIRNCKKDMAQAETERNERAHRYAKAQLDMVDFLSKRFRMICEREGVTA